MNGLSTNLRCTKSADCFRELGREFVFRYYSETTTQPEKALTPGEAQVLGNAGVRLAAVYQDRARKPEDFSRAAGFRDGQFAAQLAREVGQPPGTTIFFAVDYDAGPADLTRINAYFRGTHEGLTAAAGGGPSYLLGAYGSGLVCGRLRTNGLVTHTWLAAATGWRGSDTYQDWNVKQSVTREALCALPSGGWDSCVSQGDDDSWFFRPGVAPWPIPPDDIPSVNALPVVRRGATGREVKRLQRLLNRWIAREGARLLIEDGRFGLRTASAVRAFQTTHVDDLGEPLRVDGIVGGLTWGALVRGAAGQPDPSARPLLTTSAGSPWWHAMPADAFGGSARARAALQAAVGEAAAGAGEVGGDNMGPHVDRYLNDLKEPPQSWCAGFVCWCLKSSGCMPFSYTIVARDIMHYAKAAGLQVFKDPEKETPLPGDIIVWWRNGLESWKGHAGYVHHVDQGRLFTIEGNRSSWVQGFQYPLVGLAKLLAFVRI